MMALLSDEERARFQSEGYLLKPQLLAPEEVAEIRDAFMAMNENGPVPGMSEINPNYRAEDPLAFYPRMMHPHRHPEYPVGPLAMRYMLDARIGAILHDLMGVEPIAVQSMFYFKPPGARGQALHQDNFYLRVKPGTCIAAWVAIDDADQENGGMVVVPGTGDLEVTCPEKADPARFFTSDYVPVPEGKTARPMDMKAGDTLFFNGSVIHGSYPNTSQNRFRRAFICHYVPASSLETSHWYRPMFRFNGEEVLIPEATGGGPCGVMQAATGPH
jgi:hypothetical protein